VNLKSLFRNFSESLGCLLTHNPALIAARGQFSHQATDLEHLFEHFFQLTGKYNGSMPALTRHGQAPCSSSIQQSGLPFLKAWQAFILNLLRIHESAPLSIREAIESHANIVNSAFDLVLKSGPTNAHDQCFRSYKSLHAQFGPMTDSVNQFLNHPSDIEHLKTLESDLKAYSRSVNDLFSRDSGHTGLTPSEVVRVRTRTYTACCDMLHQVRAANLFESDVIRLLDAVREFQEGLKELLIRFNITTSFLVLLETPEERLDEPDEPVFAFDTSLGLIEFIEMCQRNQEAIARKSENCGRCFDILNSKSRLLIASHEKHVGSQSKEIGDARKWLSDIIHSFDEPRDCTNESEESLFQIAMGLCHHSREQSANLGMDVETLMEAVKMREKTIEELSDRISSLEQSELVLEAEIQELTDRESALADLFKTRPESVIECAGSVLHDNSVSLERLRDIADGATLSELSQKVVECYSEARDFLVTATDGSETDSLVEMARTLVRTGNEESEVRLILHRITPVHEDDTLIEHAQLCVQQYRCVVDQNQELLDGFANILSLTASNQCHGDQNPTVAIDSVKTFTTQARAFALYVSQSLTDILGENGEDVYQQFAHLSTQMKDNRESLVALQRLLSDTELQLMKYLEVAHPKKGMHESVRILLRALDTRCVDRDVLQTINTRLCEVLQIRPAPKDPANQIMTSLDAVASQFK
jgi:hypothetical protein